MKTLPRPTRLRKGTGTVAMAMLVVGAMVAVAGWWHDPLAATAPELKSARGVGAKCAECGTVISTLAVEEAVGPGSGAGSFDGTSPGYGQSPKRYEVTVRMNDGSNRVFVDIDTTHWRRGQRVILIEPSDHSRN